MWSLDAVIEIIDTTLDTKRKRHIVGGVMLSAALFFGGLALTVISIKGEEQSYEQ